MSLAEALLSGGEIFLLIQFILILVMLGISIQKAILFYGRKKAGSRPFHKSHHMVLFIGIFAFAWGFFEQLVGMIQALNAIIEAADVSPELILMGLKRSFLSPLIGFITALAASLFWATLHAKYTTLIRKDQ